jgi:hypothetical protein
MISFEDASAIFNQLENSKLFQLREVLYKSAFRYTECRFEWNFKTFDEKLEADDERSISHGAFIANCDIMARNMENKGEPNIWRTKLTNDRKVIGDFACMLVALIGIKNRMG